MEEHRWRQGSAGFLESSFKDMQDLSRRLYEIVSKAGLFPWPGFYGATGDANVCMRSFVAGSIPGAPPDATITTTG